MTDHLCAAIIVAAGSGSRLGGEPKQFRFLHSIPVYQWSMLFFDRLDCISEIIVVSHVDRVAQVENECRALDFSKPVRITPGGRIRQESVLAGLQLADSAKIVAIHDAARPFPPPSFEQAVEEARQYGAAIFATPVVETLKQFHAEDERLTTIDRSQMWLAQTPQVFQRQVLLNALNHAREHSIEVTDEAAALELVNSPVKLIQSSRMNLKITTVEDWGIAEIYASHLAPLRLPAQKNTPKGLV
jgi:2-C-methyl-D-erythritol 4-phosphate cytidylyltransferase